MVYIISAITTTIILVIFVKKFPQFEQTIRLALITISISTEVFYFIYKVFINHRNIFLSIPIYWCAITNIVQIVGLITKKQVVLRFAIFMVIGPTFSLLYTPELLGFGVILYYFSHSHIIMSSLFGVILYYQKYDFEHSIKVINYLTIYFIFFELSYPYFLYKNYGIKTMLLDKLLIFDQLFYNLFFIIIIGYIFLLIINLFIIDPILNIKINKYYKFKYLID